MRNKWHALNCSVLLQKSKKKQKKEKQQKSDSSSSESEDEALRESAVSTDWVLNKEGVFQTKDNE